MATKRNEKRRALVRNCARRWRGQEGELLSELADQLPFDEQVKASLNKPSILRLVNTFLRVKQIEDDLGGPLSGLEGPGVLVDMLDGFMMMVDTSGLILHVSPQVTRILGFEAHDMLGISILEFLHPDDHKDFLKKVKPCLNHAKRKKHDNNSNNGITEENDGPQLLDCTTRLKYKTLNSYNKTKQTGYLGMDLKGCVKQKPGLSSAGGSAEDECLVFLSCFPLCTVPYLELKFYEISFIIKLDHNDKPLYIPDEISDYFGLDLRPFYDEKYGEKKSWIPSCGKKLGETAKALFADCGFIEGVSRFVTNLGKMYQFFGRSFIVYGPKGEKQYTVSVVVVMRKEEVKVKNWPPNKLLLGWAEHLAVPGRDPLPLDDITEELSKLGIQSNDDNLSEDELSDSGYSTSEPISPSSILGLNPEHVFDVRQSRNGDSPCSFVDSDTGMRNSPVNNADLDVGRTKETELEDPSGFETMMDADILELIEGNNDFVDTELLDEYINGDLDLDLPQVEVSACDEFNVLHDLDMMEPLQIPHATHMSLSIDETYLL